MNNIYEKQLYLNTLYAIYCINRELKKNKETNIIINEDRLIINDYEFCYVFDKELLIKILNENGIIYNIERKL